MGTAKKIFLLFLTVFLLLPLHAFSFDNSCGVNYFGEWCKKLKNKQQDTKGAEEKNKEVDPYSWYPKFPNEVPPPLIEVFKDPSPENVQKYKEWNKKRAKRLEEVGRIIAEVTREGDFGGNTKNGKEKQKVLYSKAIYFFEEKCPSCKKMTPLLAEFQSSGKLVGIGVGSTNSSASRYLESHGVTFPAAGDLNGTIAKEYKVTGFPTLILLTDEGDVVGKYEGALDRNMLLKIFGG